MFNAMTIIGKIATVVVIFLMGVGVGGYGYEKLFVEECPPTQVIVNSSTIRAKKGSHIGYNTQSQNNMEDAEVAADTTKTERTGFFKRIFKKK